MAAFAKYDGIDGEAIDANHDKWIDILSIDWGAHKPGGGATGQSRRRGGATVEDLEALRGATRPGPELDAFAASLHLHARDDGGAGQQRDFVGLA